MHTAAIEQKILVQSMPKDNESESSKLTPEEEQQLATWSNSRIYFVKIRLAIERNVTRNREIRKQNSTVPDKNLIFPIPKFVEDFGLLPGEPTVKKGEEKLSKDQMPLVENTIKYFEEMLQRVSQKFINESAQEANAYTETNIAFRLLQDEYYTVMYAIFFENYMEDLSENLLGQEYRRLFLGVKAPGVTFDQFLQAFMWYTKKSSGKSSGAFIEEARYALAIVHQRCQYLLAKKQKAQKADLDEAVNLGKNINTDYQTLEKQKKWWLFPLCLLQALIPAVLMSASIYAVVGTLAFWTLPLVFTVGWPLLLLIGAVVLFAALQTWINWRLLNEHVRRAAMIQDAVEKGQLISLKPVSHWYHWLDTVIFVFGVGLSALGLMALPILGVEAGFMLLYAILCALLGGVIQLKLDSFSEQQAVLAYQVESNYRKYLELRRQIVFAQSIFTSEERTKYVGLSTISIGEKFGIYLIASIFAVTGSAASYAFFLGINYLSINATVTFAVGAASLTFPPLAFLLAAGMFALLLVLVIKSNLTTTNKEIAAFKNRMEGGYHTKEIKPLGWAAYGLKIFRFLTCDYRGMLLALLLLAVLCNPILDIVGVGVLAAVAVVGVLVGLFLKSRKMDERNAFLQTVEDSAEARKVAGEALDKGAGVKVVEMPEVVLIPASHSSELSSDAKITRAVANDKGKAVSGGKEEVMSSVTPPMAPVRTRSQVTAASPQSASSQRSNRDTFPSFPRIPLVSSPTNGKESAAEEEVPNPFTQQ